MNNRVIVGISGASGAPLAVDVVRSLHAAGMEVHLVATPSGERTLRHECGLSAEDLAPCCAARYGIADMGAAIASGSFRARGMIVVPASMKTVAGIASGYSDNLLLRAADVTLKERRPLIVVPRECPLSAIHLRNLLEITRAGAVVLPPVISCYSRPESIEQMLHHLTGKILDLLAIETEDFCRWEGMDDAP
ncbi:MAG: UbiX family flavin prenyltransferase [Aristaeellaceae bacterium]